MPITQELLGGLLLLPLAPEELLLLVTSTKVFTSLPQTH